MAGIGTPTQKNIDLLAGIATSAKQDDIIANTKPYGTNNIDEASSTLTYVGKEDKDGVWVIQKIDTSSGTSITYATQTNNPTYTSYSDAWTDRSLLVYSQYSEAL